MSKSSLLAKAWTYVTAWNENDIGSKCIVVIFHILW